MTDNKPFRAYSVTRDELLKCFEDSDPTWYQVIEERFGKFSSEYENCFANYLTTYRAIINNQEPLGMITIFADAYAVAKTRVRTFFSVGVGQSLSNEEFRRVLQCLDRYPYPD